MGKVVITMHASPRTVGIRRLKDKPATGLQRFACRFQESDQNLAHAEKLAPNSPKLIFAKADLYVKHNRNLDVAKSLLKKYMSMSLSPDDPPRSDAAKLLKQVQGG